MILINGHCWLQYEMHVISTFYSQIKLQNNEKKRMKIFITIKVKGFLDTYLVPVISGKFERTFFSVYFCIFFHNFD